MSKTGKFSTHLVPDEGTWYVPGEVVRIDETRHRIQIVKDPLGAYEVASCRHATEYSGSPALLRVGLRRGPSPDRAEPIALSKLYGA